MFLKLQDKTETVVLNLRDTFGIRTRWKDHFGFFKCTSPSH